MIALMAPRRACATPLYDADRRSRTYAVSLTRRATCADYGSSAAAKAAGICGVLPAGSPSFRAVTTSRLKDFHAIPPFPIARDSDGARQ
jgi:hypothetical protein